jgi:uncharacterized oligopeptide transporter (OPT) family protein
MAEEMNGDNDSAGDGEPAGFPALTMILGKPSYLLWTIGIVLVVGFVCAWIGYWVALDYQRPFDEVMGTVLVSVADGLFVGVGLLGVVAAVLLVREAAERR